MIKKNFSKSSYFWLKRNYFDWYVQKRKKIGLRSRSWFKIKEIHEKYSLFFPNITVIDLGASPGGWSQYAARIIGECGRIIASDVLHMQPILGTDFIFIKGNLKNPVIQSKIVSLTRYKKAQIIMSDMSPNTIGIPEIDSIKLNSLVKLSLQICFLSLKKQGDFLTKMLYGNEFERNLRRISSSFKMIKVYKPNSSRINSREVYVVAKEFISFKN